MVNSGSAGMDEATSNRPDGAGASATLATSVYDRLRQDILNGVLRPGHKLRVSFLRERYDVGSSPVREALNRLSSDGLAIREDQKGFRVATTSRKELEELIKTRLWVEEIAVRESILHGDREWEEQLVLAFHRLSRTPRFLDGSPATTNPEWERLHRDYHMALLSACGSTLLFDFCHELHFKADRYRRLSATTRNPDRNEVDEHREILEAAVDRDAGRAFERLRGHYMRTGELILRSNPN